MRLPPRRSPFSHHGFFTAVVLAAMATTAPVVRAAEAKVDADLLIRGARLIDGTGAPGRIADVAIRDGRIAEIGQLAKLRATRTIEARGLILSPGFVDLHSHADREIRTRREAENCVRQGVTTLVVGNCGGSPVDATGFFRFLHDQGAGVNVVLLIGHGSVRVAEMGDRSAAPTAGELAGMRRRVAGMMEAGAVGLSTSLRYRPGAYAEMSEVVAVAREIAPYGGFYATHMRDEGLKVLEAMEEAFHIGREAGVPVHISHHKVSSATGWGLTRQTLTRIDEARAAGVDVTLDQYPYGAGSSSIGLMVPQPLIAGGTQAFRQRIADPVVYKDTLKAVETEIFEKMFEAGQDVQDPKNVRLALTRIQIARLEDEKRLQGMNLAEILEMREVPRSVRAGAELVIELVGRGAIAIYHTIDDRPEGDVDRVMRHPQTSIASDGSIPAFGDGHPHPRSYGTYPRLLARYVRERGVLSWEEAIHKMTGLPAQRLGWTDRGLIKLNYRADLTLFDPEKITETATFTKPHAYAEGVSHVLIGGVLVLDGGKMTTQLPGRPVYSVPSANSAEARLRRDVLDLLGRYDRRCGVLVVADDGSEVFAFNADDRFFVGPTSAGAKAEGATSADTVLRKITTAVKEGVYSRPHAGDSGRVDLTVINSLRRPDGTRCRVVAAYDGLREKDAASVGKAVQASLTTLFANYIPPRKSP